MGQPQIEVVAAEYQMVAHGHAVELHPLALPSHANEREVGCAAAAIADQNLLARLDQRVPIVAVLLDPGVERRLRFFDQHNTRQAGRGGRLNGQLASDLVERCRQREHDVLLGQRLVGVFMAPSATDMLQVSTRGIDRRKTIHIDGPLPRQQLGRAIHARVTKPTLGRNNHPPRHHRAMVTSKKPHGMVRIFTTVTLTVDTVPRHP